VSPTDRFQSLAPIVCALALLGVGIWRTVERTPSRDTTAYMARAAARIDEVPYRIGRYIGIDADVTPGVVELLRPNRILQRRYIDPDTGESFSLVLVHCEVATDMTGHYPPNCYPRAGWMSFEEPSTLTLEVVDTVIPARRYRFEKAGGLVPTRIEILNFFVLPTGVQRFGDDIRLVDVVSRSQAATLLGAAQVQIITPAGMDRQRREAIWNEVLETVFPALDEIAGGPA
jgi:hypothetical protein